MVFIDACFRKETPYTPIWMMRQAGRYLPEYMEVRNKAGDFLTLCKNPQWASEVTIQPIDILNVDAAILFSDILVIPLEMGMDLKFEKGEGPVFSDPIRTKEDIDRLYDYPEERLTYVYETIKLTRERLPKEKALIGFSGAPWTLATYMVEGSGSKTYAQIKKLIYTDPEFMHALMIKITEAVKAYLLKQIESGVNAVMVFDSWASALEKDMFFEFSWEYMKDIAEFIKLKHPDIPVILFPKGIPGYLDKIDGNFDVFGVDWGTPMELAKKHLGDRYVLQGNMEPCRLYNKEATKEGVEKIVETMGAKPGHIFNLGHGMLPDLPVENAKYLVDLVHTLTKR
ncbi:uroporphyrinogen decarboxylase [Nitrosophilus alvini]|uniref:uroporphyrinogen decarboxylase n=1 Tax=Nitrosophilus alvini TaxID=2714855 RepID=UPI00190B698F|nr:uroporphyrinogen decarboxylase [Nitrosophilus alvini]